MALAERPVRALRFTGFGLGIWPWPIVNVLLEIVEGRGMRTSIRGTGPKRTYANIEEYSISEDKTGVIKVKIHRKAQRE